MEKKEKFYKDLKANLEENTSFPSDYLYKFIVPMSKNQGDEVTSFFKEKKAKISKRVSKTGKYTSVSILIRVASADEVIGYYRSVEGIEGLISL